VNAHLREITGRDITAKDFRTWGGTMHAGTALRSMGPAPTQREAERNIIAAIDLVSKRLGNTRTVCRKYYVHPALIEAYLEGRVVPMPEDMPRQKVKRGRGAALRRDEIAVLQFLQDELGAA
jgi:DNA topoisomerase-1